MADLPSKSAIEVALGAANALHLEYERVILKGVVDGQWAGFCAAYLLGRLGEFAAPSRLAQLLAEVEDGDDWASAAAEHLVTKLRS